MLPDIDHLRAFDLELSATLASYSRLAVLTQLTGALRLMFPSADLAYLNKVAARKAGTAKPARSIEDKLLDPIALIKVASSMMLEIVKEGRTGRRSAGFFGIGALINAAAQFPLRHRNWHMMIIGRHIDLDTGRVAFAAAEMKGREPFEGVLPPEVLLPLRSFVQTYRPLLLDTGAVDEGYLWPSQTGGMFHRNTLGRAIKTAVRKHTGKAFNFHLFRHAAATFISESRPEQTRMATGVLQHKQLRTTDKYYIKGAKRRAFKHFQKAVREVIARGRKRQARNLPNRKQVRRKAGGSE